jgi:hypothetical protein
MKRICLAPRSQKPFIDTDRTRTFSSCFSKIHLNNVMEFTSRSPKETGPLKFSSQNILYAMHTLIIYSIRATDLTHVIHMIIFGEKLPFVKFSTTLILSFCEIRAGSRWILRIMSYLWWFEGRHSTLLVMTMTWLSGKWRERHRGSVKRNLGFQCHDYDRWYTQAAQQHVAVS